MTTAPLKVTQTYIDWIFNTNRGIMAHLYKFTAAAGFTIVGGPNSGAGSTPTGANIAELVVPSDSYGSPNFPILDWANGKIYLIQSQPGTIRRYNAAVVTQSPSLSAELIPGNSMDNAFCGDVDPLTGQLIIQVSAGGLTNRASIRSFLPSSFIQNGIFGIDGPFGNYPTSIAAGQTLVCVECSGVTYGLVLDFDGNVSVIRTDTMEAAGAFINVGTGGVLNRKIMCKGASRRYGGSVFLTEASFSVEAVEIDLWTIIISPGAEEYNISEWPVPNTSIVSNLVGTIPAISIDASWTTLAAAAAIGYDNADGNVLLDVSTNTSHPNQRYIIKVNSANAGVMWTIPVSNSTSDDLNLSRINAQVGMLEATGCETISMITPTLTTTPLAGLTNTSFTSSDNASSLLFTKLSYTQGVGNPVPVSGTPNSFIGWALLNFNPTGNGSGLDGIPVMGVGPSDYFTDLDTDVYYGGAVWKSNSLRFEGLQRKVGVGVSVDEQTIKIWASPTDTLFGANFLTGAEEGLLDGAVLVRYRIIWPFVTGNAAVDIQPPHPPIAVWTLFTGYISTISKGGVSHIELKIKSALTKLNVNMPRNYFQPGCLWTLFDQGCTLSKAAFAVTGTINTGATSQIIPIFGGIATAVGADGNPQYAQGKLVFTSGINEGLQVLIDDNDTNNLYLAYLLNAVPSVGDTVIYYPGCSKTFATCGAKFNNTGNFRGFDKVPPIMVSV